MLETLLALSVIVVAVCVAGIVLAVLPFIVGVDLAERRGFSTLRWGGVCLLGVALMLAVGYLVVGRHLATVLLLPAAALGWSGPALLTLLDPSRRALGGVRGAHQR